MVHKNCSKIPGLVLFGIFLQFMLFASTQITYSEEATRNISQLTHIGLNFSQHFNNSWADEAGALVPIAQDHLILGADKWHNNSSFNIVVVGDSIAWGAGLEQDDKYYYKVADWLQDRLKKPIEVTVLAHTGATLTKPQKIANKEYAFTNADLSSWDPTISEQAGIISNPKDVDLILLSGGINDIDVNTILNPITSPDEMRSLCGDIEDPMYDVLIKLLCECPNSSIVVTSYYPIVTNETSEKALDTFIDGLKKLAPNSSEAKGLALIRNLFGNAHILNLLSGNSELFNNQSILSIRKAIDRANQYSVSQFKQKRIIFAPVDFPSNKSYGTTESWLWEMTDPQANNDKLSNDHKYEDRISLCKNKQCNWNEIVNAIGHPNVFGAMEYNRTIIKSMFI